MKCTIIPPHILERIAENSTDPELRNLALRSLIIDSSRRTERQFTSTPTSATLTEEGEPARPAGGPARTIKDARNRERLPGDTVRTEGSAPTRDAVVNQAYDWLGATFKLYQEVYGRDSIDGRGYDNAFWNGEQMVYGDGDGRLFLNFTGPIDVTAHELTHGVTQYTARLNYYGQSGALNESLSDVFGSLAKQYHLGQNAQQADWLIGEGLLGPSVNGVALRSMKAPGTAYDDRELGKDPQPANMSGYVRTQSDNGGVHINSGIPNHAFYLASTELGGNSWEKTGHIWYDTITSNLLTPNSDFKAFATATLTIAGRRYGTTSPEWRAVSNAWTKVGVKTGRQPRSSPEG
ncbi:MAG: M4 family metallopeptidase [Streptosporangiaceae bacterium]